MSDLISRQAAIDTLKNVLVSEELEYAIPALEKLPSAQKEGEWIKIKSDDGTICSNCGFTLEDWIQGIFYNFCPNCGVKMKGAKHE